MFEANGKFVNKEYFDNSENYVKDINKNSNLFYDANGALRSSISISDYGDFIITTNYGSNKSKLILDSNGTLKSTGSRLCLDDVCLNKDDILKLKKINLLGKSIPDSEQQIDKLKQNLYKDKNKDKDKIEIEKRIGMENIESKNNILLQEENDEFSNKLNNRPKNIES